MREVAAKASDGLLLRRSWCGMKRIVGIWSAGRPARLAAASPLPSAGADVASKDGLRGGGTSRFSLADVRSGMADEDAALVRLGRSVFFLRAMRDDVVLWRFSLRFEVVVAALHVDRWGSTSRGGEACCVDGRGGEGSVTSWTGK